MRTPSRLLKHLQHNAIAYTALFIALGGSSYAAIALPRNSVGTRQLKNHSITPAKMNRRQIGGTIKAWAIIDSTGTVIRSEGGVTVKPAASIPASYYVSWGTRLRSACATEATVDGLHSPKTESLPIPGDATIDATAGYAVAGSSSTPKVGPSSTFVQTFNQTGQLTALGFDVALIC